MTLPLNFPALGSGQGVSRGAQQPQTDPFSGFLTAYFNAQNQKRADSRSSAELELRRQEFELKKKALDMELADKKIALERQKAEGNALNQVIPFALANGAGPALTQQFLPMAQQQGQPFGGTDPAMQAVGMAQQAAPPADPNAGGLAGALRQIPPEILVSLLRPQGPLAQLREINKDQREIRAAKSEADADRLGTAGLVKYGLLPQGTDVVKGASKMFYDYVADVRKDARARQAAAKQEAIKGVEGAAMELAQLNPDWKPAQIKAALKATPTYAGIEDGVLAKAALEAPKNVRALTAPRNETEARARVVYGPARAALATVNAMDEKGESLGVAARLAQMQARETGIGGAGIGAAIGSPTPVTAVAGALIGGGVGIALAPVLRGAGRMSMSPDQQRLWTAGQALANAVLRPETGAQATPGEIQSAIERYLPLNTDSDAARKLKRTLRAELDKTLADVSGLPNELTQPVLDAILSQHEQRLSGVGVTVAPPTPSRGTGRSF